MRKGHYENGVFQLEIPFGETPCWQLRKGNLLARVIQENPASAIYVIAPFGTVAGGWSSIDEAIQYCCKLGYVYDDFMTI